jgi:2-polyprenyl-6-methoxyphenol hydroxylase-like FAD-dependent oxidoreductase
VPVVIAGAGQLDLASARGFATGSLASSEGTAVPAGFPDFEEAAAASPTTAAAVPQDHLEPVLLGHLRGLAGVEVRFGTELAAFDQDGGGVTVMLREHAGGADELVRAGWLVGADGARRAARSTLEGWEPPTATAAPPSTSSARASPCSPAPAPEPGPAPAPPSTPRSPWTCGRSTPAPPPSWASTPTAPSWPAPTPR